MVSRPSFRVKMLIFLQSRNTPSLIPFTLLPMYTSVNAEQFWKALSPIVVAAISVVSSPIVTFFNAVQFSKIPSLYALPSKVITFLGIFTSFKLMQFANALLPIPVKFSLNTTEIIRLQLKNACEPI